MPYALFIIHYSLFIIHFIGCSKSVKMFCMRLDSFINLSSG